MAYAIGTVHQSNGRYNNAVRDTWRHTLDNSTIDLLAVNRELVRYATLAASSHNMDYLLVHQRIRLFLAGWG